MMFDSDSRAERMLEEQDNENCCLRFLRKYRDNMPMGAIKLALFDYEDQDRTFSTCFSRIFGFFVLCILGIMAVTFLQEFGQIVIYQDLYVKYITNEHLAPKLKHIQRPNELMKKVDTRPSMRIKVNDNRVQEFCDAYNSLDDKLSVAKTEFTIIELNRTAD